MANKHNEKRVGINIRSQFNKVQTGVKNGVFIFSSPLSVAEFANKINKPSSEILKYMFIKGKMININTILNEEEIGELCLEFNLDFEKKTDVNETNVLSNINVYDKPEDLVARPPIVTIMGHVDHGKTTLLDYIRKTHVVKGEAGGITQHIGAYQVVYDNQKITFLDTPGHAAFTKMRARGANVTDIVVLVVAADDGIKPQTEEAIDHAKAAKAPIIVFINKIDKPNINVEKVLSQLSDKDLLSEEWGGNTIVVKGSALTGKGVSDLLKAILTMAEVNEYKANPKRLAMGVVIESNVDRGLGPVATILINNGTLVKGDFIIAGSAYGRVRILFDENMKEIDSAPPAKPVKITGLNEPPAVGEKFIVSTDERDVKNIAEKIKLFKQQEERQHQLNLSIIKKEDNIKVLTVILKIDVNGSLEAIKPMLNSIKVEGAKLILLRVALGGINESDINLAKASNAVIIGFNIKPSRSIKDIAQEQKVNILFYDVIYHLKQDVENMMFGVLEPETQEQETAEATILQLWHHSDVGMIAGCKVSNGEINRNDFARVLRDGKVIVSTKIASMKHLKENVNKISAGMECGIVLTNFNDVKVGDIIQTYKLITVKHTSNAKL
ncbi:MAG: translation initiation factor IF-2 [Mycoplasmataceae bacterium]|nr:translation initiation factor IF-2 [Mycoplasmataceae bacterium]